MNKPEVAEIIARLKVAKLREEEFGKDNDVISDTFDWIIKTLISDTDRQEIKYMWRLKYLNTYK